MAPLQLLPLLALGAGILGISGIWGIPVTSALGRSRGELQAPSRAFPRLPRSLSASSSLLWVPFSGLIPSDAVSSPNPRSGRLQFVCSTRSRGCNLGSFDPARGAFCSFAWAEEELRSSDFQLLLNPGGFEELRWVDASFGSVPPGAVEGCPLSDAFVGRSRDGLGKASKEQQALFVAVEGEEVWYKWYQVLAVRQGAADVSISEVSYNGSAALESSRPELLAEVAVRNRGCRAERPRVELEEATEAERGWSAELPALAAAHGELRAAPLVWSPGGEWELGNVTALPWAGAASSVEFASRRHSVPEEIPARSECSAVLRGLRREIRVPFSARLSREFRSGPPHVLSVSGWARSSAVTDVRAGLERCRRLRGLPPCPD